MVKTEVSVSHCQQPGIRNFKLRDVRIEVCDGVGWCVSGVVRE